MTTAGETTEAGGGRPSARVRRAHGERSVVSAGAEPWSRDFRNTHVELMKDLPAFA